MLIDEVGCFLGLGVERYAVLVESGIVVEAVVVESMVVLFVICEVWPSTGLRRGDLNGFERVERGEERLSSLRLLDARVLFDDMLLGSGILLRCSL